MKLGAKLRLSYVGVVVIAVSFVLVLIIYNANRELKEKIGEDLQYVANIEAENVNDYIKRKIYDIRILSQNSLFKGEDTAAMGKYLQQIRGEDIGLDRIFVIDPGDKIIASANPQYTGKPFTTEDKELMDFLRKAWQVKKGGVFFKYGYGGKRKKELKGFIFTPVTGESDTDVISVMVAAVNMNDILKDTEYSEGHSFGGKTAYLVDNKATMIITQEGKSRVFTPIVYIQADSPLWNFVKDGDNGYTIYKGPDGVPAIVGYSKLGWYGEVKGKPWLVISMAPQKIVFSPAIRLRNTVTVLGIFAIIMAWVVAFFVARGISRPIVRLANVTDKIAKGDLSQRADIELKDEVGDLAKSFNKMTDELNSAIASRDQEILERRNAEERLKEEMEARARFINMISYEFKPSLTSIREGISMVLDEAAGKINERQNALLELAKKSGESLSHLIKDIVDYHKLETDKAEFNITVNDINEAVGEVSTAMVPILAERKEVEFIINCDDALPKARFDKNKIILVLTNLVNIAVRSTEEGSVTVTTAREGDNAVRVSVKDSGPGIEQEDLSRLFEKFEQPGKAKDKAAGGTGLGMTISKTIIEKHNGKIWAESEIGKGTIYNIVLPISERRL
ncbi:MAG: ATP-binding protein [Candidatus Omnitrophota bacterium]